MPSSPQNPTGMLGKGSTQTSSPVPRGIGAPSSSKISTAMPSAGPWISPLYTGRFGLPPTKAPHRSVPPLIEARCTSGWTASYTHAKPSADSGEPVEQIVRSDDRSRPSTGRTADFIAVSISFADTPSSVTRSAAASSNIAAGDGHVGLPSYSTTVAPGAEGRHQPVPHHPAARRVVEDPVAGTHVASAAGAP